VKVEVSGDNDNSLFLITPNRAGYDNLNALAVLCREYPYRYHLISFFPFFHFLNIYIIDVTKFVGLALPNA